MRVPAIVIGILSLGLAGCTGGGSPGKGPVTLSPGIQQGFQQYLSYTYPGAFMVTPDGLAAGGAYCPGPACTGNEPQLAYQNCKNHAKPGQECYLYAEGKRIVWER